METFLVFATPMVAGSALLAALRGRRTIPQYGVIGDFLVDFVVLFAVFWVVKVIGGY